MSDGFMADPIRPGDMKTDSGVPTRDYSRQPSSSSAAGKIFAVFMVLFFVAPFIFALVFFGSFWSEVGDDIISQIEGSTRGGDYGHYYELSNEQQLAASRIFSTGMLYDKGGPKKIAQSDCRHLKNAVMGFYNQNSQAADWYDNTYCAVSTINLATYFIDETEENLGGEYARIDIGPKDDTLECINIAFAGNFRYVAAIKKIGHCNASKVQIEADGIEVPEVKADDLSKDKNMDDDSEDIEKPPINVNKS